MPRFSVNVFPNLEVTVPSDGYGISIIPRSGERDFMVLRSSLYLVIFFCLDNIPITNAILAKAICTEKVLRKLVTKARMTKRRKPPCKVCTYATSASTLFAICESGKSVFVFFFEAFGMTYLVSAEHSSQSSVEV